MNLQTNISYFLPSFCLGITKNKNCPFPWSLANWMGVAWYKLQRYHPISSFLDNPHACCYVGHSESLPEHMITSSETSKDGLILTSRNLLDWLSSGLRLGIYPVPTINFSLSFVSMEMPLIPHCSHHRGLNWKAHLQDYFLKWETHCLTGVTYSQDWETCSMRYGASINLVLDCQSLYWKFQRWELKRSWIYHPRICFFGIRLILSWLLLRNSKHRKSLKIEKLLFCKRHLHI